MRRRNVHVLFGAAAVVCAALAVHHGLRLSDASEVNAAIESAQDSSAFDARFPEARFARALKWSSEGNYEAALHAFRELAQSDDPALSLGAEYNLGNLHLRAALADGAEGARRSLPLVELAKESYRRVLRRDPDDWDARYNLERALRLAPELDDPPVEDEALDQEDRVMSTLPGAKLELP